jgi:hypothetical protein
MAEAEGILIASAVAGFLGWRTLRATRAARREQLRLLDAFLPLLSQVRTRVSALGYPVVTGRLDGHALRLELVPDSLAFRALPVLWLEARWAWPHSARLQVVVQPTGAEYFDDDRTLTRRYELRGWPATTQVWGEGGAEDLARRLGAAELAGSPEVKRVSVRADQLCVTFRCARADPAAYRVLRRARFDSPALDARFAAGAFGALRAIERALGGVAVGS